jgi:molybdate transport system substrate-binding protein
MVRTLRVRWLGLMVLGMCAREAAGGAPPAVAGAPATIKVFAAGSLTGAMTAVMQLYEAKTGQHVQAEFGPAGLLRERIENGEHPDIFASANMAHPQALADRGLATQPVVLARNRLCAKALPEFGLTTQNLLQRLLDPKVGLGTSTPKADPGGDYAWELFARAEKVRPGAQAILERKAQQLVGGKSSPPVPAGKDVMTYYYEQHKISISLGYCSSRQTTPDPKFASVELPPELAVHADYGMSVLNAGGANREAALRFALFVMSPEAQHVIGLYGFTPVAEAYVAP